MINTQPFITDVDPENPEKDGITAEQFDEAKDMAYQIWLQYPHAMIHIKVKKTFSLWQNKMICKLNVHYTE